MRRSRVSIYRQLGNGPDSGSLPDGALKMRFLKSELFLDGLPQQRIVRGKRKRRDGRQRLLKKTESGFPQKAEERTYESWAEDQISR